MALLALGSANAEIYTWTDANGGTVFSERPPSDATDVQKVELKYRSVTDAENDRRPNEPTPETAAPRAPQQIETAAIKAQKKAACSQAHKVLNQLQRSSRLHYVNENKQRAYLTEQQRQERMQEAREKISAYCG